MADRLIPLGWEEGRAGLRLLRVPVTHWTQARTLTTGRSGSGKTAFQQGILLDLLVHHPGSRLVFMDCKGHGAGDLLDRWLPVLSQAHPHVRPEDVTVVAPWGRYAVPMNLLAPVPGLEPDVHATVVVSLFESLLGDTMGQRMAPILHALVRAGMEIRGSLVEVARMLEDVDFRARVAARLRDPELRHYVEQVLPTEPVASLRALSARLRGLLALRRLRAMLGAESCLAGPALLDAPLTVVTLGDPPLGMVELSAWLGRWWMQLLAAAIFARREPETDIVLFLDEFDVVAPAAAELERILQKARSFRASIHLATQSLAQIRDPALVNTVLTNIGAWAAFTPQEGELRLLSDVLPRARGVTVDPELPDRLLAPAEEEKRLHARLRALQPRQAIYADLVRRQSHVLARTMNLPFETVRERAGALPPRVADAFWRGRHGALPEELHDAGVSLPAATLVPATRGAPTNEPTVEETAVRPRSVRRERRMPALELP